MAFVALLACGEPDDADDLPSSSAELTWDEFLATSTRTAKDGTAYFVIEGDIPIPDEEALRSIYDQMTSSTPDKALVKVIAGEDVVWENGEQFDLTYCIATSWPPNFDGSETGAQRRQFAIDNMEEATRAWSAAANVYFRYVSSEDVNCAPDYEGVQINVVFFEPSGTSESEGCAFWPDGVSCGGFGRSLAINYDALDPNERAPLVMHELGHILGLMHEQFGSGDADGNGRVDIANSINACDYDSNWRRLDGTTTYDSLSIMGYDTCNMNPGSTLSPLDGMGIRELYGAPAAWHSAYGFVLM